jgi:hypothetical protein
MPITGITLLRQHVKKMMPVRVENKAIQSTQINRKHKRMKLTSSILDSLFRLEFDLNQ